MIIRPFTHDNINYVFSQLWERGLKEMQALGTQKAAVKARFIDMIGMPWTFAFYDGAEPCALGYMEQVDTNKWRTHFVATDAGWCKIWMPITIFLKKISDNIVQIDEGRAVIEAYSLREARKWFKTMGFKLSIQRSGVDKFIKFGKLYIRSAVGHGA